MYIDGPQETTCEMSGWCFVCFSRPRQGRRARKKLVARSRSKDPAEMKVLLSVSPLSFCLEGRGERRGVWDDQEET